MPTNKKPQTSASPAKPRTTDSGSRKKAADKGSEQFDLTEAEIAEVQRAWGMPEDPATQQDAEHPNWSVVRAWPIKRQKAYYEAHPDRFLHDQWSAEDYYHDLESLAEEKKEAAKKRRTSSPPA